jgi:hypothetical protein
MHGLMGVVVHILWNQPSRNRRQLNLPQTRLVGGVWIGIGIGIEKYSGIRRTWYGLGIQGLYP